MFNQQSNFQFVLLSEEKPLRNSSVDKCAEILTLKVLAMTIDALAHF